MSDNKRQYHSAHNNRLHGIALRPVILEPFGRLKNDGEEMSWKCDACGSDNPDESSIRCVCGYERQDIETSTKNYSGKKALFWVGEILSVCGAIYCMMGYAMVASFSVAAPEGKAHWESMGRLYIGGIAMCVILMLVFAIAIFKFGNKNNI